jgi:hypothetical protein
MNSLVVNKIQNSKAIYTFDIYISKQKKIFKPQKWKVIVFLELNLKQRQFQYLL